MPNDVLIDGAKVAGILLESGGAEGGRLTHVVIGIGVNVAWSPDDMPYPVTSLAAAGFALSHRRIGCSPTPPISRTGLTDGNGAGLLL